MQSAGLRINSAEFVVAYRLGVRVLCTLKFDRFIRGGLRPEAQFVSPVASRAESVELASSSASAATDSQGIAEPGCCSVENHQSF